MRHERGEQFCWSKTACTALNSTSRFALGLKKESISGSHLTDITGKPFTFKSGIPRIRKVWLPQGVSLGIPEWFWGAEVVTVGEQGVMHWITHRTLLSMHRATISLFGVSVPWGKAPGVALYLQLQ